MLPEYCGAVDCSPTVANDGASLAFLLVCMYSMYVCVHTPLETYMAQPCIPLKYLFAVLLVVAHVAFVVFKYLNEEAVTPAEMFGFTTRTIAYLFYAAILTEHPYRDLPLLRAGFFGMAILGFWQCQQLLEQQPPDETWKLAIHGGGIFLSGLALLPAMRLQRSDSPFDSADWFSRLTFTYVTPMIATGDAGPFQAHDIPALPVADGTAAASHAFLAAYRAERSALAPSLLRLLWCLHGRDISGFFIWAIGNTLLSMMTPLLTKALLEWSGSPVPSPSRGYLLASALTLHAVVSTVSRSQYALSRDRFSIRFNSGLQAGVYARLLELDAREASTSDLVGQVTNYLTVDVPVIVRLPGSLFDVALLPIQIGMALAVLGNEISFAFGGGLILLGAMVPLQILLAHVVQRIKGRLMRFRDARLAQSVAVFTGIRTLKCFGWVDYFLAQLDGLRLQELRQLRLRQYITAFCDVISSTAPVVIQTGVFVVIVYTGQSITAARAYTIISLLTQLVGPITDLPWIARSIGEAVVSFGRLTQHLFPPLSATGGSTAGDRAPRATAELRWCGCSFAWEAPVATDVPERSVPLLGKAPFILHIPQLAFAPGEVVVVCGASGSGKSSLLLALMGEMPRLAGTGPLVAGTVAYAPQTPWLLPASLRHNVTLQDDGDVDVALYARVIAACAIEGLPDVVSEDGANLSGGQKARIGLARALYQRAALYLLDDCWSGLDRRTAKHIMSTLLSVVPSTATVVIATHALDLVGGMAPTVVLLEAGAVVEVGNYATLIAQSTSLFHRLGATMTSVPPIEPTKPSPALLAAKVFPTEGPADAVVAERREDGVVAPRIWWTYAASMGYTTAVLWPLSNVLLQMLRNGMDYWTAQYTTHHAISASAYAHGLMALTLGTLLATAAHVCLVVHGTVRAARTLYGCMTHRLVHTSLAFFDATPVGRVLNRLGDDTSTIDLMIPIALDFLVLEIVSITGSLLVLYFTNVYVLLLLLPLGVVYVRLQRRYRPPARDLSRLSHVVQSPLVMHVKATLQGLAVLRGRGATADYHAAFVGHLGLFQRVTLAQTLALSWLAIRLDALSIVVAAFVGFFAAIACTQGHPMPSAYLGLTMMYALPIIRKLKFGLEAFVWAEQAMVSVERVLEYAALPPEAASEATDTSVGGGHWVTAGVIELVDVGVVYDGRAALRGVSVAVRSREKLGICGPSGAGKSSLISVLLRAVVFSGRATIDGVDIAQVSLAALRAAVAYVPQATVLFAGTVRSNLDPLGCYDDARLWAALSTCGLGAVVRTLPLELETPMDTTLLSQGQQQLLAVGRAVLKRAKVVCIDEATANLDHATDAFLRERMAVAFADATVLTVAHRLATIAQSDRVLVLDQGAVVECDTPARLLANPHGYLRSMA
ncbi:ATP-binding Cassette (ABC) Superfamily [Achlya hypogyna]|uniref:ATP-binding Cassette (ABC) Superfamily n=1 Tax=Achlya hypogyna TaxID=1202772 RepID=A0A1V9ZGK6_ACHHY|nr:ATP-binding Cassette (ABC) Superfamily [Achlya hypogyna]